jgi:hypothetical protein
MEEKRKPGRPVSLVGGRETLVFNCQTSVAGRLRDKAAGLGVSMADALRDAVICYVDGVTAAPGKLADKEAALELLDKFCGQQGMAIAGDRVINVITGQNVPRDHATLLVKFLAFLREDT